MYVYVYIHMDGILREYQNLQKLKLQKLKATYDKGGQLPYADSEVCSWGGSSLAASPKYLTHSWLLEGLTSKGSVPQHFFHKWRVVTTKEHMTDYIWLL